MRAISLVPLVALAPWIMAFDLSRHSVPPEEILSGGPPKDGIPAILNPRFVPAGRATFLREDDRVIGVVRRGAARAYPVMILNWPPSRVDRRLPPKERILGLEVEGEELAISFRSLAGRDQPLRLRLAEVPVEIRYDQASETAEALVDGKPFPAFTGYWFAWYGFHPKTKVWGESDETSTSLADDPSTTIVDHEGGWGDLTGVGPGGEIADAGSFYLISGTLRKLADSTVAAATGGNLGPADGHDLPGEDLDRVSVGEAAPDFLLEDHRGERVRLSQFRGERPVVLVFYRGKW